MKIIKLINKLEVNLLRKKNDNSVYQKYRSIYDKKAMMVKRNADISFYKINYEKCKKQSKEFIQDIKNGNKIYDEFDN